MKIIKTLSALMIFILIGPAVYLFANAYSEIFAQDIAYLECKLETAGNSEGASLEAFMEVKRVYGDVAFAHIQRDWIKDNILLNWIEDDNTSENGLQDTVYLSEQVLSYSGLDLATSIKRSFDRETLRYRWEKVAALRDISGYWFERSCRIISRGTFEVLRRQAADGTAERQNI